MLGKLSQRLGVLTVNDPILLTFLLGHTPWSRIIQPSSCELLDLGLGLGTERGSPARAMHALNHPAPPPTCFKTVPEGKIGARDTP